jgi:hypothetical protein
MAYVGEKMGVNKTSFDGANRDDRPVGVAINTGDASDDTGCCMVRTGEGR